MKKFSVSLILLFAIFAHQYLCQGQLKTYYSNVKLPHPSYSHSIWYDEDDYIYIFGGGLVDGDNRNQILKYSLTTDQITTVGNLPGSQGIFELGRIAGDNSGNIFIFWGRSNLTNPKNEVIRFSPSTNTSEIVAHFPKPEMNTGPIIKPHSNSNKVLIFGERFDNILREFDMETFEFRDVGPLFELYDSGAAIVRVNDSRAYIFHNHYGFFPTIKEMDLETNEIKEILNSSMPGWQDIRPQGLWDGKSIFLVSSFGPLKTENEGILKFDPNSATLTFYNVTNWPVDGEEDTLLAAPQCAYVSKLNRIYCFGGFKVWGKEMDDIFYVPLDPLNED